MQRAWERKPEIPKVAFGRINAAEWDAAKGQLPMKPLPDFVTRVKEVAKPGDTVLVMCRSGGRSAIAVNLRAQA
jgi:rhodanese-related sulfurtransferase